MMNITVVVAFNQQGLTVLMLVLLALKNSF
jgi:hypothetical protein